MKTNKKSRWVQKLKSIEKTPKDNTKQQKKTQRSDSRKINVNAALNFNLIFTLHKQ